MIRRLTPLAIAAACIAAIVSCSTHTSATPAPAPVAGAPASNPDVVTLPPRRVPPSRDSLSKLRAVYVAQVLQQIAGHENEPAGQVFKNVQVLKDVPAAQLVHMMDTVYGAALSWNCTNCHRLANQGNWASDTSNDKRRARFMQQMTNVINLQQLPQLYPRNTPVVSCGTCHRGYNEPPPPTFLIPERGKPGGPPLPPARGAGPGRGNAQ